MLFGQFLSPAGEPGASSKKQANRAQKGTLRHTWMNRFGANLFGIHFLMFFLVFFCSDFCSLLAFKMESKSLPKSSQIEAEMQPLFVFVFVPFFLRFPEAFWSFSRGPDPWFHWQVQHIRGFQHFFAKFEKIAKTAPTLMQNATKMRPQT